MAKPIEYAILLTESETKAFIQADARARANPTPALQTLLARAKSLHWTFSDL